MTGQGCRRVNEKTRKKRGGSPTPPPLILTKVEPQTDNQDLVFDHYDKGRNLLLTGSAGSGKTFVSLYLALQDVARGKYERVHVVRSIVSSRDPGFLPGSLKEKVRVYEAPYMSVCSDLYRHGGAYDNLKSRGIIEFTTTSFIRGTTFNDCVLIVDEIQNMRFAELDTIITRVGRNCRIVLVGDFRQTDLLRADEKRGLGDFVRVIKRMGGFGIVEFTHDDILRSDVVRDYLVARDELGIEQ